MKLAFHLLELLTAGLLLPIAWVIRLLRGSPQRAVVVGWWGSETVGDVAILGQLLAELREAAPEAEITVVSFKPEITRETLDELSGREVRLVPLGASSGRTIVFSRCMIYGGGPLMESRSIPFWMLRSLLARLAGTHVVVYSCGIGPVRRGHTKFAVTMLLQLANQIIVRDRASLEWNGGFARKRGAVISFDPAFHFVRDASSRDVSRRTDQLALALRFPPAQYLDGLDDGQSAEQLIEVVALALNQLLEERPLSLVGCVMHTGFPESDDHRVYERLRLKLAHPHRLEVAEGRHSVAHVIGILQEASGLLTLRFHGMIFALATQIPFVAIDCVRPAGKITAAAELAGCLESVLRWDELEGDLLARRLRCALYDATPKPMDELVRADEIRVRVLREAMRG